MLQQHGRQGQQVAEDGAQDVFCWRGGISEVAAAAAAAQPELSPWGADGQSGGLKPPQSLF